MYQGIRRAESEGRPVLYRRLFEDEAHAMVEAFHRGDMTEGRASSLLAMDRVDFRVMVGLLS